MTADKPDQRTITNFEECVSAGNKVESGLNKICRTDSGDIFMEKIKNLESARDLIKIDSPISNESIAGPLLINGSARGNWFFEASFPVELTDGNKKILARGIAQAKTDWMTTNFVEFHVVLPFSAPLEKNGFIILRKDNPSGLPENDDAVFLPINFGGDGEMMSVLVYFGNSNINRSGGDCASVSPVKRQIAKTTQTARRALENLFLGPNIDEQGNGYFTSLNPGINIQNLTIEKGIARVDLDEQLQYQVAGSCRVSAIRSQIEETLMQFPTVQTVIISINGRTEDILQP